MFPSNMQIFERPNVNNYFIFYIWMYFVQKSYFIDLIKPLSVSPCAVNKHSLNFWLKNLRNFYFCNNRGEFWSKYAPCWASRLENRNGILTPESYYVWNRTWSERSTNFSRHLWTPTWYRRRSVGWGLKSGLSTLNLILNFFIGNSVTFSPQPEILA